MLSCKLDTPHRILGNVNMSRTLLFGTALLVRRGYVAAAIREMNGSSLLVTDTDEALSYKVSKFLIFSNVGTTRFYVLESINTATIEIVDVLYFSLFTDPKIGRMSA